MSRRCSSGSCHRRAPCSPKPPRTSLCEALKNEQNPKYKAEICDCKVDWCGRLPRRVPLLGEADPQSEKCKRAFQVKSEQGIWDIGVPYVTRHKLPLKRSRFRTKYERGLYPFKLNHSGDVTCYKIAWCMEVEQCDVVDLIRDSLEGQSDNWYWATIAHLVYMDVLKHVPPVKLAAALPAFSVEFRIMIHRNNDETTRRVLKMLKELALVATSIGPELAFYAHDFFVLCYQYVLKANEVGDRITYEQKKRTPISDLVEELHAIFEVVSGSEQDYAVAGMKLAVPTYRIPDQHYRAQK
ncbi:unnamed protein product [Mesocestoides corti]|uniref:Vegetative incompatibility protein HET-E-1 n=1 Tax=Mesocestoides corti TaxID=53468 RepID=A0A0R3U1I2_MESCO|nr:unnamed protein product [Mesocestoides corti]